MFVTDMLIYFNCITDSKIGWIRSRVESPAAWPWVGCWRWYGHSWRNEFVVVLLLILFLWFFVVLELLIYFHFILFYFNFVYAHHVFDKMLLLILINIGSYDAKRQSKMFSELNWCFDIVISNLCFYLSFYLYFFVQWQTRRSWIGSVAFEVYY
jgi:hypothetical protein